MAKIAECGEPNFYRVETDDGKGWLAVVQFNGEMTTPLQRRLAAEIAAVFETFENDAGEIL